MHVWLFRGAWIAWGLWFLVWESIAIFDRGKGDTLSEQVWRLLDHPFSGPLWYLTAALLIWLLVHFLFIGRWG